MRAATRQLGAHRSGYWLRRFAEDEELSTAADQPLIDRFSLRRLLEDALDPYVRLAESGALRARRVASGYPPPRSRRTRSGARPWTSCARRWGCPRCGWAEELPQQPTPAFSTLAALRAQLDEHLGGTMSPAQTRLTAVLAVLLDTKTRSGELAGLRTTRLAEDHRAVCVERRPRTE
ncbi:hypothetical protein [Streptomyces telluris]|uniref:Uncharacterized protein n=1 Tax=Streptomyces telluris TaxID=2720021 RepID=A0A9X2RML3_9ACTN|nr:hypothetical protein [Streptomyces telluris]MCQ8772062.1 hypothetical protein [Streptomyces telluris]